MNQLQQQTKGEASYTDYDRYRKLFLFLVTVQLCKFFNKFGQKRFYKVAFLCRNIVYYHKLR